MQGLGEFGGEQVGVDAEGFAVGTEADGRHDGHDLFFNQLTEEIAVNTLHFAGELLVDAFDDSEGQSADRIRGRTLQRVLREAFHEGVGNAGRGANREVERDRIGDTGAVGIGDGDIAGGRELDDLLTDAMHQHDLNAE